MQVRKGAAAFQFRLKLSLAALFKGFGQVNLDLVIDDNRHLGFVAPQLGLPVLEPESGRAGVRGNVFLILVLKGPTVVRENLDRWMRNTRCLWATSLSAVRFALFMESRKAGCFCFQVLIVCLETSNRSASCSSVAPRRQCWYAMRA